MLLILYSYTGSFILFTIHFNLSTLGLTLVLMQFISKKLISTNALTHCKKVERRTRNKKKREREKEKVVSGSYLIIQKKKK
jgi:hypothetical protein